MAVYSRSNDRRRIYQDIRVRDEELAAALTKSRSMSPKMQLEQEKRVRREIANSNERRRMQSINAGFENLKSLIPHLDGEKYSKASVLQLACDHMKNLEDENLTYRTERVEIIQRADYFENLCRKLEAELRYLKHHFGIGDLEFDFESWSKPRDLDIRSKSRDLEIREKMLEPSYNESPPPKRKKRDTDEGISMGGMESGEETVVEDPVCIRPRQRWVEAKRPIDPIRNAEPYNLLLTRTHEHVITRPAPVAEVCKPSLQQPVARQNLELMVQAIQHLEGDRIFRDHTDDKSPSLLHCQESEKEGSLSDPDEFKSESSDRDSVSPSSPPVVVYSAQLQLASTSPRPGSLPAQSFSEKYPVAAHLLHRPIPPQYLRPGVIVHKS